MDDHHGPHHEAVMVRELCIAVDENRFTVFTAEEICHFIEYELYNYIMRLHLSMMFGVLCCNTYEGKPLSVFRSAPSLRSSLACAYVMDYSYFHSLRRFPSSRLISIF